MCLLIASSIKVDNEEWLENGFSSNSHGAGFCYAHKGKLVMEKGFFEFGEFLEAYKAIPNCPNIVHFRLATGGKMNKENCHPFLVNEKLAFGHNGVIFESRSDENYSDTWYFNNDVLQPVFGKNPDAIFTDGAYELITKYIGNYNKLAFLNNKGRFTIMNFSSGMTENEKRTWFSNGSYLNGARRCAKALGANWSPQSDNKTLSLEDKASSVDDNVQAWLKPIYEKHAASQAG